MSSQANLDKIERAIADVVGRFGSDNIVISRNTENNVIVISVPANMVSHVNTYIETQIKPTLIIADKNVQQNIPNLVDTLPFEIKPIEPIIGEIDVVPKHRNTPKISTYNKFDANSKHVNRMEKIMRAGYTRTQMNQRKYMASINGTKHK